jgi:hypothetical protein
MVLRTCVNVLFLRCTFQFSNFKNIDFIEIALCTTFNLYGFIGGVYHEVYQWLAALALASICVILCHTR